ncbi:hypothetical protein BSPWISOX_2635 [uncultured Gammaproteobacteria bacterium]|nr:hypothetical protein BSPWISOX_2635 [uncultured Gammaproteobacteria bacterium]
MHFILQSDNLSKDIQHLKFFTAKKIINFLQQKNIKTILEQLAFYKKSHKNQTHYQLWQEGCHPKIISTVGMMRQKIQYIHDNPVKRGYVDLSEHWRYSSYRNYFDTGLEVVFDGIEVVVW